MMTIAKMKRKQEMMLRQIRLQKHGEAVETNLEKYGKCFNCVLLIII